VPVEKVAVQIDCRNTGFGELLGEFARLMLGAHEQDSAAITGGESVHQLLLRLHAGDVEHVVGHLGHRRVGAVDRVQHRVVQEPIDELVDAVVEGCREQQTLAAARRGRQDASDAGKKSEIGHVIGLVDHRDLNRVQADQPLLHQVFEPAGARHDNVDARLQRRHLPALRYATEDRGHPEVVGGGQRFQRRGYLAGKLPRGGQNQTRRSGRAARISGQPADHRNREGERLAAARLAAAEDVAAGECVGKSVDLDGKRLGDPEPGKHFGECFTHAEIGKCIASSQVMSFSIGCAELAARCARSVSTRWRDCQWAKSIAALRTAPDSVRQPLEQGGRRKDEEAFHDVLAIE